MVAGRDQALSSTGARSIIRVTHTEEELWFLVTHMMASLELKLCVQSLACNPLNNLLILSLVHIQGQQNSLC